MDKQMQSGSTGTGHSQDECLAHKGGFFNIFHATPSHLEIIDKLIKEKHWQV